MTHAWDISNQHLVTDMWSIPAFAKIRGPLSALSVVDPNGKDGENADLPFSREQVLRENYGAWLRVMGLNQAAERLMRPPSAAVAEGFEEKPVGTEFLVYEHEGRKFAFYAESYDWFWQLTWDFPAVGVDLSVLKAISTAIDTPSLALTDLLVDLPSQVDTRQGSASIFPDGSFLGLVNKSHLSLQMVRL